MSIKFHGFKKYHMNIIISEEILITHRFRFSARSLTLPRIVSKTFFTEALRS